MLNYLFKNIPEELWKEAKHFTIDHKISLRQLIINALQEYITSHK